MGNDVRPDPLFERFRDRGDVEALGRAFDLAAPELYRVAVHLAGDLHAAEDLVQSAFLAAIEARARWDASRPLLPWLLGILVRKASHARRAGAREVEPDRLAPRAVAGPSEEAEASELRAVLDETLARVPPPYREVLLLHLARGLDAREIALELGRAPGTVRVQIHRGLAILREKLPAGLATAGALAAASDVGWSAVREQVVAAGRAAAEAAGLGAAAAGGGATVPAALGGVLAMKKLVAIAALVLAGAAAWFGLRPQELEPPSFARATDAGLELEASAAVARPVAGAGEAAERELATLASSDASSSAASAPSGWTLRGRLHSAEVARLELATIVVRARGTYFDAGPERVRGRAAPDGSFAFDLTPLFAKTFEPATVPNRPSGIEIAVDHPEAVRAIRRTVFSAEEMQPPPAGAGPWTIEAEVELIRGACAIGSLRNPDGSPAVDVELELIEQRGGEPSDRPIDATRSDAEGRWRLAAPRSGSYYVLATAPSLRPHTEVVELALGGTSDLGSTALERGASISGRVLDVALGAPAGCQIGLSPDVRGRPYRKGGDNMVFLDGRFEWSWPILGETVEGGIYEVPGLAPVPYVVRLTRVPDSAHIEPAPRTVTAPASGVDFTLDDAQLAFLVRRGKVSWSATIRVSSLDEPRLEGQAWSPGLGPQALRVPHSRTYAVEITAPRAKPVRFDVRAPGPGRSLLREVDLESVAGAKLRVEIRNAPRTGRSRFVRIQLLALEPPDDASHVEPHPGGRRAVYDVGVDRGDAIIEVEAPAGRFELCVLPEHQGSLYLGYWRHDRTFVDLDLGRVAEAEVELALGGRLEVSARAADGRWLHASCRLRDARGELLPIVVVTRNGSGGYNHHPERLGGTGFDAPSEVLPNQAAGSYELELSHDGFETERRQVEIRAGETTVVEVVLRET